MVYFDPKQMRAAVREMVRRVKPNGFLTFGFGHPHRAVSNAVGRHPGWHPVPPNAVHERVRQFFDQLVAQADTPLPPGNAAFGFLESPKLNPHLHVVAALDEAQFDWLDIRGKAAWGKLSGNGQLDIQVARDPAKVLSYCMKRFTAQAAFENMFIY